MGFFCCAKAISANERSNMDHFPGIFHLWIIAFHQQSCNDNIKDAIKMSREKEF